MTSIGERLRRQRLQNRISLEKVSLETKIGVRLLEAIESEQFQKLPGGVFRRSFVLQYARALGVDPDEIAAELKQLSEFDEVPAPPVQQAFPVRQESSGLGFPDLSGVGGSTLGSLIAAVGVILACALIYSWWQTPGETRPARNVVVASAPPPQKAEAPVSAPAPAPAEPTPAVASPAPAPTESTSAAVASPAPLDNAPVRVDLSADERTWISISTDGKNVFANSLEPHQTKMVQATEKIRILIGNAGGLEITLNGKPIGPIGPRGQIRIVELTSAGFQIVQRKPPTVEPL